MKNKKTILLFLAALFTAILAGAGLLYNNLGSQVDMGGLASTPQAVADPTAETEPEPSPAPDFTVYDLKGAEHKLSDFRGKPVVLNFWASWCGPCVMEMPEFQNFYDKYGDQVHFVLVNLTDGYQETVDTASAFLEEHGYTLPVYYDTGRSAAMTYGVNAVPVSYFIDENGNFAAWAQGALSAEMLQQGMDLLLAE